MEEDWRADLEVADEAVVTNLTAGGEVWLVPGCRRTRQAELGALLRQAVTCGGEERELVPGEAVLAAWEDCTWYRGTVVQVLEDRVRVLFVDWGNKEDMARREVTPLRWVSVAAELLVLPAVAVRCVLPCRLRRGREAEVLEVLGRVQEEAATWTSPATYRLCGEEGGAPMLRLAWREGGRSRCLATTLLAAGLARPRQPPAL